jgi:hypothetical protein
MHADQPNKPSNGTGSIQEIQSSESTKALVVLNWSLPENYDRTIIDYYELTLIGTHSNTTTIVKYVGPNPQQSFSHNITLEVSERNCIMSASILAVDMCGQQSEQSYFVLTKIVNDTSESSTFLTPTNCTILASFLGGIAVALLVILVIIIVCFSVKQCRKERAKELQTN